MVRESSTLACLALTSAVLASFVVPIGSEAAAVSRDTSTRERSGFDLVLPTPPDVAVVTGLSAGIQGGVRPVEAVPARVESPRPAVRIRVPVGCDRIISGLVRSAAASQIGSCVT